MSDFKYSLTNLKPVEPTHKVSVTFPDGKVLKDKANVFDQWFRRAKVKLAADVAAFDQRGSRIDGRAVKRCRMHHHVASANAGATPMTWMQRHTCVAATTREAIAPSAQVAVETLQRLRNRHPVVSPINDGTMPGMARSRAPLRRDGMQSRRPWV